MHVNLLVLEQMGCLERGKSVETDHVQRGHGHVLSAHNPVWSYCKSNLSEAFGKNGRKLFMPIDRQTPWEEIVAHSRLGVFIGATKSAELDRYAKHTGCLSFVFEPDMGVLGDFVSTQKPSQFAAEQCFFFGGSLETLRAPLSHLLPRTIFDLGFPVFYIQEGLREAFPEYVDRIVEQLEFLYYRYNIYPVRSALYSRSRPLRNITSGLFFDQQKHFYENIPRYLEGGNIRRLKDRFQGATALAVLAGPGLESRLEYIRRERRKSLLICVNSALAVLLEHGIEPDIAIISDNTDVSGASLKSLRAPLKTVLVGHCLSQLDTDAFSRHFLYGNWEEELFGERDDLLTHGSVLTTVYSLTRHLGCERLVLVSAILAGTGPWRPLAYAVGAPQSAAPGQAPEAQLINKYPQLYPARNSRGETMYTTLNFRDVAFWLLDELRGSPMEVINTAPDSILWGPGVRIDEAPDIPEGFPVQDVMDTVRAEAPDHVDRAALAAFLERETGFWTDVAAGAANGLAALGQGDMQPAMACLRTFDATNVTYLVHRFEDFNNTKFSARVFDSKNPAVQGEGLQCYLDHVRRMASLFLDKLQQTSSRVQVKR